MPPHHPLAPTCPNTDSPGESPPSPNAPPASSSSGSLHIRALRREDCRGLFHKSRRYATPHTVRADSLSDGRASFEWPPTVSRWPTLSPLLHIRGRDAPHLRRRK